MTVPFHAIAVHFAVSLTVLWFFFELISRFSGREKFRYMADWLLGFGILATGIAVIAGLQAESQVDLIHPDGSIIPQHKMFGIMIFSGMSALGLWRVFLLKKGRVALHVLYLVAGLLVVVTVYRGARLGSQLVYVHGVGIGTAFSDSENTAPRFPTDANYYICPECSIIRTEPGRCTKCGKSLKGVDLSAAVTQTSQDSASDSLLREHPKIAH